MCVWFRSDSLLLDDSIVLFIVVVPASSTRIRHHQTPIENTIDLITEIASRDRRVPLCLDPELKVQRPWTSQDRGEWTKDIDATTKGKT